MAKNIQTATVVGVFRDRQQAQKGVEELKRAGFREDQIGVATRSEGHESVADKNTGSKTAEGAAIGAATGAGVGVLWGIGVAASLFPPLGLVAGGTLMALLASAGTGAAVATVIGALVGLGVPEDEAAYYEGEVKSGRTLVTVQAEGRQDEAWAILSRCGAYNRSSATASTGTAPAGTAAATSAASRTGSATTGEGRTFQVHEEQLHAHKQPVQTGEVNVRKEVHTEHRTMEVPVQREEVVIERHPATGQSASAADFRPGEEIRIPVKEEQVHVEKTPVVKEEVTVGKRKVQDTQTVSGDVRKEEVKVEQKGNVDVHNAKNPNRGK